ncbi:MAG TPA: hypothetical protein VHM19_04685 [Polyangiales bacterium]|jgi:hypothetical protein|nr:hypothetical protein [Polyangiales bacterium]
MSFDANSLLANFFVSGIGFVLFRYGKSQHRMPQAVIGVVMMVYPYFITSVGAMLGTCAALCALLFALTRVM